MKTRKLLLPLSLLSLLMISGCSINSSDSTPSGKTSDGGTTSTEVKVSETSEAPNVENSGTFTLTTSDGNVSTSNNIYTISSAGTYVASGVLDEGKIVVAASESDEVILELNGATISCSSDAPINVTSASKVEISAKSGTSNAILDKRSTKLSTDTSEAAEGAISAKSDLKLKGSGTLVVSGNYNNGVHTTKDLTIQKENLHVTAVNNAIKGKDSITLTSGTVTAISKKGNGLKTDNTDLSTSGNQRGNININGGTLVVDSTFDGIDAAYNVVINEDNEESVSTSVTIKTGKNSSYSSNYSSSTSAKGIKASNLIDISAGTVAVKASDDAIHANYGDALTSGGTGQGLINISGGAIGIASGDDGVHADNTLTITGGTLTITNASEGIETNHLKISGGETYVYGTDDGVNASKKINQTPTIEVSGGFLDVTVSTGDTDGIDTNGNFTQTGGFIVTRGSHGTSGGMSTGLDCDGTASISGGTFISFNGVETSPKAGSGVLYAYYGNTGATQQPGGHGGFRAMTTSNSSTFAAGTYTLSGGSLNKTFKNEYTYSAFLLYSSELSTGTTYTLKNDSTSVLSWTQNSSTQSIN